MREYIEKLWNRKGGQKSRKGDKEASESLWRKLYPARESAQSRDSFMRQNLILTVKYGALVIAALAVCRGVFTVIGENVSVSSSVNGRELPIYCVDTDEKKIALSFDAAWGNEDTAKILEILDKQNVKVTFFMTGGWVLR